MFLYFVIFSKHWILLFIAGVWQKLKMLHIEQELICGNMSLSWADSPACNGSALAPLALHNSLHGALFISR